MRSFIDAFCDVGLICLRSVDRKITYRLRMHKHRISTVAAYVNNNVLGAIVGFGLWKMIKGKINAV